MPEQALFLALIFVIGGIISTLILLADDAAERYLGYEGSPNGVCDLCRRDTNEDGNGTLWEDTLDNLVICSYCMEARSNERHG